MNMRIYCILIALLHAGPFERKAKAFSSPSGFSSLGATSQLFTRVQSQHHHTSHSCRGCYWRRGLFMRDPQEKGKAKKRKQQQKQKGDKGVSGERAPRVDPNAPISVRRQIKLAHGLKKLHEAAASNDNGGDRPVLNPADALKDAANQRRAKSRKFRRSKDEAQAAFVARRSGGGDPDGTRWIIPKSNRGNRRSGGDDDGWRVLVDGYNVVGASREYAKARDLESMEAARAAL